MWAIFQSNAGGAWDNAKKSSEKVLKSMAKWNAKGSDAHKAAVTGDTAGGLVQGYFRPVNEYPYQTDMSVGLAIAPILGERAGHSHSDNNSKNKIENTLGTILRLTQTCPQNRNH